MSRTAMFAAVAAMLAVSPMALAADTTTTTTTTKTADGTAAVTTTHLQPDQVRASKIDGAGVYDNQNKKIGSVKDIVMDSGGKIALFVLDIDGKYVGLPPQDAKIAMDAKDPDDVKLTVAQTQDQLKSKPDFKLDNNANKTSGSGSSTVPANKNK
jgi:hypothetical protein